MNIPRTTSDAINSLRLQFSCAQHLAKLSAAKIVFILTALGAPPVTPDFEPSEDGLLEYLVNIEPAILGELEEFLLGDLFEPLEDPIKHLGEPLKLFISYPDGAGRQKAEEISTGLEQYGIIPLVASQDIKPGAEWADYIDNMLDGCHGLLCLDIGDFATRPFCQQEVGWVLGRKRPVLWLCFDETRKSQGIAERFQAKSVTEIGSSTETVAETVAWCANELALQDSLLKSLQVALAKSQNYKTTRLLADVLRHYEFINDTDIQLFLDISRTHNQVGRARIRDADDEKTSGPFEAWPLFPDWIKNRFS